MTYKLNGLNVSCRVDLFNKRVKLGLIILDMFTKQVGFGLTHIAEYSWLDMTRTQIATPNVTNGLPITIAPIIKLCQ